jgi:hypothetical protein
LFPLIVIVPSYSFRLVPADDANGDADDTNNTDGLYHLDVVLMCHLTCYTFSFTYINQTEHYNQLTLDQFFYQVLIQSTFNKKNKDNSDDDNDDNHVQDVLASNQHQLLVLKGMNCTPRYQVDYAYAQGMLIMHKPWNNYNTLDHNETHHRQRRIPNGCDAIYTNIIIFPSKWWKELKSKDYLSTRSYFH